MTFSEGMALQRTILARKRERHGEHDISDLTKQASRNFRPPAPTGTVPAERDRA
jgi:hypothetical protein